MISSTTQIIKAIVVCYPHFFISNIGDNKKQMVHTIELFSNRKDAKAWVDGQKTKFKVQSSRISVLNKKEILSYRIFKEGMEVSLKVNGGMMNNFKDQTEHFYVRCWSDTENLWVHAVLSPELISHYTRDNYLS